MTSTAIDVAQARTLRAAGMTYKAIGRELGVSRERIRQLLTGPRAAVCAHCDGAMLIGPGLNTKYCSAECRRRGKFGDLYEVDPESGCWNWRLRRANGRYGQVERDGVAQQAHRWMWELHKGPIPDGLEIDHLCRNTGCVNPDHLEPVTHAENVRRYWAAVRGYPLAPGAVPPRDPARSGRALNPTPTTSRGRRR